MNSVALIVNETVRKMEQSGKFVCPKDNQRNAYTKACWLLSQYQRAIVYLGENPQIRDNIEFVKSHLEELRTLAKA